MGTDTEFRRDAFMLRVGELAAEFKSVPIFRPVRQVLPHESGYWFMTKAKSLSPAPTTRYWRPSSS
jgi:hypothetical protein